MYRKGMCFKVESPNRYRTHEWCYPFEEALMAHKSVYEGSDWQELAALYVDSDGRREKTDYCIMRGSWGGEHIRHQQRRCGQIGWMGPMLYDRPGRVLERLARMLYPKLQDDGEIIIPFRSKPVKMRRLHDVLINLYSFKHTLHHATRRSIGFSWSDEDGHENILDWCRADERLSNRLAMATGNELIVLPVGAQGPFREDSRYFELEMLGLRIYSSYLKDRKEERML
jgi:hypothetical protein